MASPGAGNRVYELERVDTTAIVQLYADGFEKLGLRDKLLAYHLTQAAIAGRDIYLQQRFRKNLGVRWVLESLWLAKDRLADDVRPEVERYCKLFWAHSGIHDNLTTRKNLLRLTRAQFDAACAAAVAAGQPLDVAHIAPFTDLGELYEVLTDPESFASVTDKSPEHGRDPLLASCNDLYVGVAGKDLQGFVERYPLASRLQKKPDGTLEELVCRCGDGDRFPPGLYARELAAVNEHLRMAQAYAPPSTRVVLDKLIRFQCSGEPADWRDYNIAWIADKDPVIDSMFGFVEVYLDVRGIKGAWEGIVSCRDDVRTRAIAALAAQAQWFEDRMPWAPEFRKAQVTGISARAISILTETGDSGPITPVGINLPNEEDLRQQYGSKSVNLANVVEAYAATQQQGSAGEFAASPEEAARATQYAAAMDDLHTNLHEVIGHASGQVRAEVGNPAEKLGSVYSTLEEARADLVGLYWLADPKLREMGLVPNEDAVLAKYEAYARNALVQLRRVPPGGKIEEDHMRNRQLIVHWLLQNSDGVVREERGGKTYYRVAGVAPFQAGCGRLLAEVMRIKATGDGAAGKALVDDYGTRVDAKLHAEVLARLAALHLPSVTAFVQPELQLVRDAAGNVTDVVAKAPMSLADQMLGWSGRRKR